MPSNEAPAGWGRKTLATLAVTVLTVIGGASAANAYNTPGSWNTSATPLTLTSYGSTAKAYGSASIYNGTNGTRIYTSAKHTFFDADNHQPFLDGTSEWNAGTCGLESITIQLKGVAVGASASCAAVFNDGANFGRSNGSTSNVSAWTAMPAMSAAPNSGSDRGRAVVKLCLDIPWRTDPCTGSSYSPADTF